MLTLHNPKIQMRQIKQGDNWITKKEPSNANICINLYGKIYELGVGETKTFPCIAIKGKDRDIGLELLERFPFLQQKEVIGTPQVEKGEEKPESTEDEVTLEPLRTIDGLGEKSIQKLKQVGVITLEDWTEFKKDETRMAEILGKLVASKFKNK